MYVRYITTGSNKFMENVGLIRSIWKLKVSLSRFYTMIPKFFGVSRPVRTGLGNNTVPRVYKKVAFIMASVVVTMTSCMHSEIEREWGEGTERIFLRFLRFYLRC